MLYQINGFLMSGNDAVAEIKDGLLFPIKHNRLPLYLQRCNDLYGWLKDRAVDRHRTNSRLLRRLARVATADDPDVAMKVYGATITDNFWVKPEGMNLDYLQVRFYANPFADTALFGSLVPFTDGSWNMNVSSPELTNTGSFEKCWKKEDGIWWLYKEGNIDAQYAELFIYHLGKTLGLSMAEYVLAGDYVKSKDITNDASVNLDPASGLIDNNYDDYLLNYDVFTQISPEIANAYVNMLYLDALCNNVDRHENNYGLLRDASTGDILSFAPLFDHNIALFCKDAGNVPASLHSDLLISEFYHFIKDNNIPFDQPILNESSLRCIAQQVPISYDTDKVVQFIMGRQKLLEANLRLCVGYSKHNCVRHCMPLRNQIQSASIRAVESYSLDKSSIKKSIPER